MVFYRFGALCTTYMTLTTCFIPFFYFFIRHYCCSSHIHIYFYLFYLILLHVRRWFVVRFWSQVVIRSNKRCWSCSGISVEIKLFSNFNTLNILIDTLYDWPVPFIHSFLLYSFISFQITLRVLVFGRQRTKERQNATIKYLKRWVSNGFGWGRSVSETERIEWNWRDDMVITEITNAF